MALGAGAAGGRIANFDLPSHFDDIILSHEVELLRGIRGGSPTLKTQSFLPAITKFAAEMRSVVSQIISASYTASNRARISLNEYFIGLCIGFGNCFS